VGLTPPPCLFIKIKCSSFDIENLRVDKSKIKVAKKFSFYYENNERNVFSNRHLVGRGGQYLKYIFKYILYFVFYIYIHFLKIFCILYLITFLRVFCILFVNTYKLCKNFFMKIKIALLTQPSCI
jgi:hypothetical protein